MARAEPAVQEARRGGPVAPSLAFDEDIARITQPGASPAARRKALERGRLVHRLMQSLPDIPPERRTEATARFLTRAAAENFSDAEQAEIARQVAAILNDASFVEIFAAGSRARVPPLRGHHADDAFDSTRGAA